MLFKRVLLVAIVVAMARLQPAQAGTTYYWKNATGNSIWDSAAANWTIGGGDVAWVDDVDQSAAVFDTAHGAGAGTVTVSGTRSANSITFGNPGFTLNGGAMTLGGASPNVIVNADATTTSGLAGASGLVKSGSGTLTVGGTATYTGATVMNNGTLKLQAAVYTLPSSTVAYWNFDDSANLGNDSGPNANNLTASGSPAYSATGKHGGALSLDGGSCMVPVSGITGLPVGNDSYTIAAWIWLDPTAQNASGIVGWGTYGAGNQVNAFRTNGPTTLINYWWSADLPVATPNLASAWHHVAATTDVASNTRTIYVDGVPRGSDNPGGHAATDANFAVGRTAVGVFGLNELFKGQLDDVLIANQALSQSELQSLMELSAGTSIPATTAVQINAGATLDLNGASQIVASLADGASGGGAVTNSAGLDATLILGGSDITSFSGVINDGPTHSVALTRTGAGSLVLSGASSYSGGTLLNSGTLAIAADSTDLPVTSGPIGTGALRVAGGTLQAESAAHTLGNAVNVAGDFSIGGSQDLTLSSPIDLGGADRRITVNNTANTTVSGTLGNTGAGFFYKDGAGTLTVTGTATVDARLYLDRGAVVLSGSGSWTGNPAWMWQDVGGNDAAGTRDGDTPTLTVKDNASFTAPTHDFNVNEGSGGTGIVNLQDQGTITVGNTWVSKGAATTGIVNQTGGVFTVNGTLKIAHGGTGTYNLDGGTLVTKGITRGGGTPALNFSGGTLQAGADFTMTNVPVTINADGAIVDTNGKTVTISSPLAAGTGNGGLTKQGDGTLAITVPAAYTGPTVINRGVLQLQGQRQPVNPMGFYAFDDSTDLGKDSGPKGNSLTALGAPAYSADGKHGGALSLDGTSCLVPVSTLTDLPVGNGSYTIAAWMWLDASSQQSSGIVGWGAYGSTGQVNAFRTNFPTSLINYWWSADLGVGTPSMAGAWHHVACTTDSTTNARTIYLDGSVMGSDQPGTHNATDANFAVGRTATGVFGLNEFLTGQLDDVLIANRALSQMEIQSLMNDPLAVLAASPVSNILPVATKVKIGAEGVLDLNGTNQAISGLAGPAGAIVINTHAAPARLTLDAGTAANEFKGTILDGVLGGTSGQVSVAIVSGGLTLSGASTYSGGTAVDGGTLTIANAAALPAGGSLTIGPGGTVVLSSGLSAGGGAAAHGGAQPVPEPGTLALLAAAVIAIFAWRRARHA